MRFLVGTSRLQWQEEACYCAHCSAAGRQRQVTMMLVAINQCCAHLRMRNYASHPVVHYRRDVRLFFALLGTLILFWPVSSFGYILGIGFNGTTMQNEVRRVDPVTGVSTLLNSFMFSSGSWTAQIVVDEAANRFYAESGDHKLYQFDVATGAILSITTLDTFLQAFVLIQPEVVPIPALSPFTRVLLVLVVFSTGLMFLQHRFS